MARTRLNAVIAHGGSTYTIPNGKYAVFAAHGNAPGTAYSADVLAGGEILAGIVYAIGADAQISAKPLIGNAGQVISVNRTSGSASVSVRLTGFLYDE